MAPTDVSELGPCPLDGLAERYERSRRRRPRPKVFNFRGSSADRQLRVDVYRRDNFTCQHCGSGGPHMDPGPDWNGRYAPGLTLDHVLAVASGGATTIDNLQLLCQSCNSRKGARADANGKR